MVDEDCLPGFVCPEEVEACTPASDSPEGRE
jgi:hypothetical protein